MLRKTLGMTEPQDPFTPPSDPYGVPQQPAQPQAAPPPYGAPVPYGQPLPYGTPVPLGMRRNGLGTAALVLGIVSFCAFSFVIPPVLAVVFGVIGRNRAKRGEATNKGVATAGLVLGSITLVLAAVAYGFLFANFSAFQRLSDCQQAHQGDKTAQDRCARDFVHDVFGIDTTSR